jgi:hypothetical protein
MDRRRGAALVDLLALGWAPSSVPWGASGAANSEAREPLEAQLEALKQHHERELEALERRYERELGALREDRQLACVAASVAASPKRPIDRLSIDGKAFLRYSYEVGDSRDDLNEFDIDRIYLGVYWKLTEKWGVRYTLEGGDLRENGGDYFDVTTKHFFLEVKDVLYPSTYLRVGQADLPWVPYEEAIWGSRVQGTVFPDREGYLTSTDLGVPLQSGRAACSSSPRSCRDAERRAEPR